MTSPIAPARANLTVTAIDLTDMRSEVEWVATVFPDWTTLQLVDSGMAFALNRADGRVYKLPDDRAPFVQFGSITEAQKRELVELLEQPT